MAVKDLLAAALPELADPIAVVYDPQRRLELRPGCSVLPELNEAINAWKSDDADWQEMGVGLARFMRATAECANRA